MDIELVCKKLRAGAEVLATQNAMQKNEALECVCKSIENYRNEILLANKKDIENAKKSGMIDALIERLSLDDKKIDSIIQGIQTVISQSDPIGEQVSGWRAPNGMQIRQVRCPLGVCAIIYESRPNVTADAFCLAYKSGNAILLRGSSSALVSNKAIEKAIKEGLSSCKNGVPNAIELVESTDRSDVEQILNAVDLIDVVLPRGGKSLIDTVVAKAKVPVIQTGSGVCHLYVDCGADLRMAVDLCENAKIQRPGACNAIETILVHKNEAKEFLPLLVKKLSSRVQLKCDECSFEILQNCGEKEYLSCVEKASDGDFGFEFLDYICSIKIVESLDEAIDFINSHNTKHSECIVTNNRSNSLQFQQKVDAACVYVNASTRFTDGGEFGFGMELGISTQKLHARGPMGISALTTVKFLIDGNGNVR